MHTSLVTTYSLSSSNTEFQGGFQNSADLIDSSTTTFVAKVDEGYSSSCYFGERNVARYLKMDVVDGGEKKDAMMKETEEEEEEEEEDHQRTKNEDDGDRSEEEVVVRWERYLPRMAVRVLLVEADHSTRHIITALLRKCSYSVTAVSDGLKAWENLKSKATDLDLILTEVELPSISGFALLTLIMEHDVCKNIPVIMMSSHDSVSMVLKCMLKGAADFLIKPVRRNELRNLWQHVWRRHATSMPPQNTTFPPEKLTIASQDNSASNQSSGSVASSQKNNECCENLIEAQSACASPFLKVENTCMENMQDASQLKSSLNLSNTDVVQYEISTKIESKSAKHNDETGHRSVAFVSEAASCNKTLKSTDLRLEQDHCSAETEGQDEVLRAELSKANSNCNPKIQGCSGNPSRAIDLIATFENLEKPANENCSLNGGNTTKFDIDSKLELTLRRGYSDSSFKQTSETTEEKQILNPSNTSAFSRYSGNSKLLQPLRSTPSVNSAKVNSIDWNSQKSHRSSGNTLDTSCRYGGTSKNQVNMTTLVLGGQIGPKLSTSKCGLLPVTGVTPDIKAEGCGNVFTSGSYAQSGVHPIWNPKPACQKEGSPFPTSASSQSNQSHNSEQPHCYWPSDAAYTSLNQNVHDKSNLDEVGHDSSAAGQSAGSNLCHDGGIRKTSSAHESIGSASDGNATSTVVAKNNPENLSESGHCNYDGFRGTNSHRSSQREAALTKFRLKRKERCYEKKVRYQSRKTLAEQRPRVKGQFVRQVQHDHPVADANGDS